MKPPAIKKLLNVEKTYEALLKKYEYKKTAWFLSSEGQKAYEKAKSKLAKFDYFQSYLMALACETFKEKSVILTSGGSSNHFQNERDLYDNFVRNVCGIAGVLLLSIDGADVPYGKYPEILNADINPILAFFCTSKDLLFCSNKEDSDLICESLLEAMWAQTGGDDDVELPIYKRMTPATDAQKPEYKIERTIVSMFHNICDGEVGYYPYEIVPIKFYMDNQE